MAERVDIQGEMSGRERLKWIAIGVVIAAVGVAIAVITGVAIAEDWTHRTEQGLIGIGIGILAAVAVLAVAACALVDGFRGTTRISEGVPHYPDGHWTNSSERGTSAVVIDGVRVEVPNRDWTPLIHSHRRIRVHHTPLLHRYVSWEPAEGGDESTP